VQKAVLEKKMPEPTRRTWDIPGYTICIKRHCFGSGRLASHAIDVAPIRKV